MSELAIIRYEIINENKDLIRLAEPYYDPSMEYHNLEGHAIGTLVSARRLAHLCIESGLAVDLDVINRSSLFHDADVHKPLTTRYPTYERRSAAISRRVLSTIGDPDPVIRHSSTVIIETTYGIKPSSLESAIVKRADILNIGEDYNTFVSNSIKILREHFRRNGLVYDAETVETWIQTTGAFIHGTLREDEVFKGVDLSEIDELSTPFRLRALQNASRFMTETYSSLMSRITSNASESD